MRALLMSISLVALGILFVGPVLHAAGVASADFGQYGILVGTVGWFATAPFWVRRAASTDEAK